jgi:hypothetical protein
MSELGDSGGGLSAHADPPVRPVIAATAHRMYSQRPRNRYSSSSAKCKLTLQTYEAEQFRSLSRRRHWQIHATAAGHFKPDTAPFELGTKPGVNRLIRISLGYVVLENCPQQK